MRFKTILLIAALAGLTAACGEKEPQTEAPEIRLQVTPNEISVSSDAQEVTLTVNADSDWGVTPVEAWVKTSPTGGIKGETALKVSVEENKTGDTRQTTLLFKYGTSRLEVPVRQHYKVQSVSVQDKALLAALLKNLDNDGDGVLSTKEVDGVTSLDLSDSGLTDISELADLFPGLTSLDL